jgi:hypothetical protein
MGDVADLLMPKLGLTMTEGTVARWVAAAGQRFAAGDVIVVVETDKIANDVEAPAAGELVSLLSAEGEVVPVGTPIAQWRLDAPSSRPSKVPDEVRAPVPSPASTTLPARAASAVVPSGDAARIVATPYARRLARDAQLDLSSITGSGPRGRIKAADVLRARESNAALSIAPAAAATHRVAPAGTTAAMPSFVATDVDVSALRAVDARLAGTRDRAFERTAYVALACIKALGAEDEAPIRLGFPIDHGMALLEGSVRDTLSAVAARLARMEPAAGGGDAAIFIVEGRTRLVVPAVPQGWRLAIGIGGVRQIRGGDATHEMTVSIVYEGAAVDHDRAAAWLSRVAALLEEPLHLLAI